MILIIDPSVLKRGTSRYCDYLQSYLRSRGIKSRVLRPRFQNRLYSIVWELLSLYFLSVRRNDLVIYGNGRMGLFAGLVHNKNMLVVLDFMRIRKRHEIVVRSRQQFRESLVCFYQTFLFHYALNRCKQYLCISEYVKSTLETMYCVSKTQVLYPPPSFTKNEILEVKLASPCSLDTSKEIDRRCNGIWISGVTPNKDFKKGAKWLAMQGMQLDLHIFGVSRESGSVVNTERLKGSRCKDNGVKLGYYDYVNNETLVELYTKVDLSICLSADEGFGIPFLDAIMFGLPIIASRISPYQEIVRIVEQGILDYDLSLLKWVDTGVEPKEATQGLLDHMRKAKKVSSKRSKEEVCSHYLDNLESFLGFNKFELEGY